MHFQHQLCANSGDNITNMNYANSIGNVHEYLVSLQKQKKTVYGRYVQILWYFHRVSHSEVGLTLLTKDDSSVWYYSG